MGYLKQPRERGKSWVFSMPTPPDLIGLSNPWDGRPLRKAIGKGLSTRHLPEARKRRDIALGDIRRLQRQLGNDDAWSLQSALAWRAMTEDAQRKQDGEDIVEGHDPVLNDRVEQAAAQGAPSKTARHFVRIASGKGHLLTKTHEQYVDARRPGNPYGYSPLKRTTVMNLDTAVEHLRAFLAISTFSRQSVCTSIKQRRTEGSAQMPESSGVADATEVRSGRSRYGAGKVLVGIAGRQNR